LSIEAMSRRTVVGPLLARHRAFVQGTVDACAWVVALFLATLTRYDFHPSRIDVLGVLAMVPLAIEAQLVGGYIAGLYRGIWRYGSFDEVNALGRAVILTTALLFGLDLFLDTHAVPLGAVLMAGVGAIVFMGGARYGWRMRLDQRRRPSPVDRTRLLVFGAGEGGVQVITAMLRDPRSPYYPVGLVDDDPAKCNLRILGVPVLGTRKDIARAVERSRADALLVAIPSADADLLHELSGVARDADLPVKVLPAVRDLFGTNVRVSDIKDMDLGDILGRRQVETDIDAVAGYLTGKRVLVTGAGGSIGSELCRQIARFEPEELLMLDRNEGGLHAVQLVLQGRALLDSDDLVLASIREPEVLQALFEERRPQVVFHAAALKHLPLLERHPDEALKTNVIGTLSVLQAAAAAGAERFVNISSDKAADPTSVLGYSKRVGERLTSHFAGTTGEAYLSVRFGNVLASSGSVLATFHSQLAAGGPITVTHPDVTRFFMTVEEACQLVIQAGAIGSPGEVLVLDMGQPIRIADVARRLAAQEAETPPIVFTGLRPGEKLHETLFGQGEADHRPIHPLISHVPVPPLEPDAVLALDVNAPRDDLASQLARLCLASVDAKSAALSRDR
jgi:FlaA1/EpsC-like NDP-sugar epimerase